MSAATSSAYMAYLHAQMEPKYTVLKELRTKDELTDSEQAEQQKLMSDIKDLRFRYDKAKELESQARDIDSLVVDMHPLPAAKSVTLPDGQPAGVPTYGIPEYKSASDIILDSPSYRHHKDIVPGAAFQWPSTNLFHKAAWVPGNMTYGGGPVQIFGPNTPPLAEPILDLIPTRQYNAPTVPYLAPVFTNNAAGVAMAAAKPESTNTGDLQYVSMVTIAHWKDVPRQLLQYYATLRGVIDDEMMGGLLAKLVDMIVNGPGTGQSFAGLSQLVTATATGTTLIDQIFDGISKVAALGAQNITVLMNPSDFAKLQSRAYTDNKYYPITANDRFYGYRTVLATAVATGTAYVGDFARGTQLYVAENAGIRSSEAPGFKSNLITILAELTAVLLVPYPRYLIKCAGTV